MTTDEQRLTAMTLEEAEAELSNRVYAATRLFEDLEHAGKTYGNGHHARQAICKAAVEELRSRWKGKTEGASRP